MKTFLFFAVFLFFPFGLIHADRGPVIRHEGVHLSQQSQKAIILHNSVEQVLILGTELKASREIDVLEFIPFPTEPKVSLAKGNPFEEAVKLINRKGLVFESGNLDSIKGGEDKTMTPVEIRFSEKVGLHDVTVIKTNDIGHFVGWLDNFFKTEGISADKESLSDVYRNAEDYLARGINFFVFDQVKVSSSVKFVEPLIYRFETARIYYPLKTSNLIGGKGDVELILVLPGSMSEDIWQDVSKTFIRGKERTIMVSSSSKIYPEEMKPIYPDSSFFNGPRKLYLQAFRYTGPYNFKDDFTYPLEKLVPYAYRYTDGEPALDVRFTPPLTGDERRDMREWFCTRDKELGLLIYGNALDCRDFIPDDEYDAMAAVFRNGSLSGIPTRDVVIERTTLPKQYKKGGVDQAIVTDFNSKNKVAYPLENAFPADRMTALTVRDEASGLGQGKTSISRAGFNKDRTQALLYVQHVESRPRSLAGYFVTLEKKERDWKITGSQLAAGY